MCLSETIYTELRLSEETSQGLLLKTAAVVVTQAVYVWDMRVRDSV